MFAASFALALAACGETPAARAGQRPAYAEATETADGGEATCEARRRSRVLCTNSLTQRCQLQSTDCEATCDTNENLSLHFTESPSTRIDLEPARCRDRCRQVLDACVRALVANCPRACD